MYKGSSSSTNIPYLFILTLQAAKRTGQPVQKRWTLLLSIDNQSLVSQNYILIECSLFFIGFHVLTEEQLVLPKDISNIQIGACTLLMYTHLFVFFLTEKLPDVRGSPVDFEPGLVNRYNSCIAELDVKSEPLNHTE